MQDMLAFVVPAALLIATAAWAPELSDERRRPEPIALNSASAPPREVPEVFPAAGARPTPCWAGWTAGSMGSKPPRNRRFPAATWGRQMRLLPRGTTALSFVSIFTLGISGALGGDPPELSRLDSVYPSLDALYQDLHRNPELSNHEEKTAAKMAARLRELGFEVTEHVGGYGVVGDIVLGILGALVGGAITSTLMGVDITGFNLESLLVAVLGAIVVIFIARLISGSRAAI